MTSALTIEDLELAWKRIRIDRRDRSFVRHPHAEEWIHPKRLEWFSTLIEKLKSDSYAPGSPQPCDEPKGKWATRPGIILPMADELIYNALVGRMLPAILTLLEPSQHGPDMANPLSHDPLNPEWIREHGSRSWQSFRAASLARLSPSISHVLMTDISGFYENIDHTALASELRSAGADPSHIEALSHLLKRWSSPRNRGIPQAHAASHVLSKVYLHSLDDSLAKDSFDLLRFQDDMRIFTKSHLDAQRALMRLDGLVRNKGLNLQSAKTEIATADEARRQFLGAKPVIEGIAAKLSVSQAILEDDDYSTPAPGATPKSATLSPTDKQVAEQAFKDHFDTGMNGDAPKFDKSLFHFLLNKLAQTHSDIAVPLCMRLLLTRPEETLYVLKYFDDLGLPPADADKMIEYIGSPNAIYDYQLYRVARWFYGKDVLPSALVALARVWFHDHNKPAWLRSYAIAILGKAASKGDLDQLEADYSRAQSDLERADICFAMRGLETQRRNDFYKAVAQEGFIIDCAASAAKQVAAA